MSLRSNVKKKLFEINPGDQRVVSEEKKHIKILAEKYFRKCILENKSQVVPCH